MEGKNLSRRGAREARSRRRRRVAAGGSIGKPAGREGTARAARTVPPGGHSLLAGAEGVPHHRCGAQEAEQDVSPARHPAHVDDVLAPNRQRRGGWGLRRPGCVSGRHLESPACFQAACSALCVQRSTCSTTGAVWGGWRFWVSCLYGGAGSPLRIGVRNAWSQAAHAIRPTRTAQFASQGPRQRSHHPADSGHGCLRAPQGRLTGTLQHPHIASTQAA